MLIKLNATGICHSDLHFMMNDWGLGPMSQHGTICAGHEGAGIIVKVGDQVKNLKAGQRAGFKPIADTCGVCDLCRTDKECYCAKAVLTGFHCDGMIHLPLKISSRSVPKPWLLFGHVADQTHRQLQTVRQKPRAVHYPHSRWSLGLRSWAYHVLGLHNLHFVENGEPETRTMGRLPRWWRRRWHPRCPTGGRYGLACYCR